MFTRNMAINHHQITMPIWWIEPEKDLYSNIEICNYLNIKQNIDLIFYTQQLFQFFFLKEFAHTKQTFYNMTLKKTANSTKQCEIFIRKYLASRWVMIMYNPFSCNFARTKRMPVKKENSFRLFHNFLH